MALDYRQVLRGLGKHWKSQLASFKPFPVAHVVHPCIDALLRLRARHGIAPAAARRILCPVAEYIVGIVCEPTAEKRRPLSDSHGRVSLQYTLAEALVRGRIGRDAYAPQTLVDPVVSAPADRVEHRIDPSFPGPERFQAQITVELHDGTVYGEVDAHNRGSAANPMSLEELTVKFDENAAQLLTPAQRKALVQAVLGLDGLADAAQLVRLVRNTA